MDSSQEISRSPSISSTNPLKAKALARIKNGRNDSTSSPLQQSDPETERGGVRSSVDSLIERTKSRRTSNDDGLPSPPSNLSKLVPGRVKKKQKRREEAERKQREEEEQRGRRSDGQTPVSALSSRSNLEDGEGSLTTFDSESDSPILSRPNVESRDSHIGYLTSSSPLIKTTAPEEPAVGSPDLPDSLGFSSPQYLKSNTLPTEPKGGGSSGNLTPQHAATFNARGTSQSPGAGSRIRGVSPGARLREVFKSGSRNNSKGDLSEPKKNKDFKDGNPPASGSLQNGHSEDANGNVSGAQSIPAIRTGTSTPPLSAGSDAPETTITPPTPTDYRRGSQDTISSKLVSSQFGSSNPNVVVSPSGNMISHRRARSDTSSSKPSRLSQPIPPIMTPLIEETRTPGGTARASSSGSAGGGFFSSVFSAAQNMTTTLTNTIANNPPRPRSSTATNDDASKSLDDTTNDIITQHDGPTLEEKKPLAVDTLGSGELSLKHLGISTESLLLSKPPDGSSNDSKNRNSFPGKVDEKGSTSDEVSAARAVSAAYSEKPVTEGGATEDTTPVKKALSAYAQSIGTEVGEKTPPAGSIYEGSESIRRSGSVRSRVGNKVRRHRNSSSATGNTVGTTVILGEKSPNSQPAGFAVASKKRNREFHQLFKSVPEEDFLIEDYSCALQREIIIAGRLYISESHICFSSNILGWITTLVISFSEVVAMEKENTAVVFPNAIAIQTLHARHTFRSLLSRDATYELLIGIWRLTHPNLKNSGTSARLDPETEEPEKADPSHSSGDASDFSDEIYDEDQEDGHDSSTENAGGSVAATLATDDRGTSRKVSTMGQVAGSAAVPIPIAGNGSAVEKAAAASTAASDFPGPAAHGPTECPDGAQHLDKELNDDIVAAPLGKVFSMVFGSASGGFMSRWLVDDMKCSELQVTDEAKKGLSDDQKSRSMSYIKPLYAPIGPKSTKCLVTETLDFLDLERAACVTASTQTPDVPSGNAFVTKTHFCFMWASNNSTRVIINYTIEWTGKSWLKGPIEKGATDGQTTYCVELVKALKAGVSSSKRPRPTGGKASGNRRRKGSPSASSRPAEPSSKKTETNWGPLEPIRGIVSPVTDIFAPFVSANIIIGFLLIFILVNYFRQPGSAQTDRSVMGQRFPVQKGSFEGHWYTEEGDLWDWLDQRIGVQVEDAFQQRQSQRPIGEVGGKMRDREVREAIKRTEETLERLKRGLDSEGSAAGKEVE